MNHDDQDDAPEVEKRRMSYRIPAQNQTPQDREFYKAMMSAVLGETLTGETPAYDLPDWLDFTTERGTITITTRFFPTERGIGFIIGGNPFTLTLLPASKAKASEKQALLDVHDFLSKRNAQDGIEYPRAEFAFAEAETKRLNITKEFKQKVLQVEALQYELETASKHGVSDELLMKRYSLTYVAGKVGLKLPAVSEHAQNMRDLGLITTPPRQNLTRTETDRLIRRILSTRQEGRNKNDPKLSEVSS